MVLTKGELGLICVYCKRVNQDEALNGDDIEDICNALKEFNGD